MAIGQNDIGIEALNTEFGNVPSLQGSINDFFNLSDGRGQGRSNWHGQQQIGRNGGPTGNYGQSVGQAFANQADMALSLWAGYDHYAPFVLNWAIINSSGADVDYTIRLTSTGPLGPYVVDTGTVTSGSNVGFLWTAPGTFPFDDPWVVGDYRIECALSYGRGGGGPAIINAGSFCQDLYGANVGNEGIREFNQAYPNWNLQPPPAGNGDIPMDWFGAYNAGGGNIAANRATDFRIEIN